MVPLHILFRKFPYVYLAQSLQKDPNGPHHFFYYVAVVEVSQPNGQSRRIYCYRQFEHFPSLGGDGTNRVFLPENSFNTDSREEALRRFENTRAYFANAGWDEEFYSKQPLFFNLWIDKPYSKDAEEMAWLPKKLRDIIDLGGFFTEKAKKLPLREPLYI